MGSALNLWAIDEIFQCCHGHAASPTPLCVNLRNSGTIIKSALAAVGVKKGRHSSFSYVFCLLFCLCASRC